MTLDFTVADVDTVTIHLYTKGELIRHEVYNPNFFVFKTVTGYILKIC